MAPPFGAAFFCARGSVIAKKVVPLAPRECYPLPTKSGMTANTPSRTA
jgi:hypothetical protein